MCKDVTFYFGVYFYKDFKSNKSVAKNYLITFINKKNNPLKLSNDTKIKFLGSIKFLINLQNKVISPFLKNYILTHLGKIKRMRLFLGRGRANPRSCETFSKKNYFGSLFRFLFEKNHFFIFQFFFGKNINKSCFLFIL